MRVLESVRVAVFERLQHLPLSLHQKFREGDLVELCVVYVRQGRVIKPRPS